MFLPRFSQSQNPPAVRCLDFDSSYHERCCPSLASRSWFCLVQRRFDLGHIGWLVCVRRVFVTRCCLISFLISSRRKRYRLRPRSPLASAPASSVPGVSILRPLKGLETNLFENIESTFTQDYPNFEILLCVAEANDPALPVVRDVLAKYPRVNAKVMIGEFVICLTVSASLSVISRRGGGWRESKGQQSHSFISPSSE